MNGTHNVSNSFYKTFILNLQSCNKVTLLMEEVIYTVSRFVTVVKSLGNGNIKPEGLKLQGKLFNKFGLSCAKLSKTRVFNTAV